VEPRVKALVSGFVRGATLVLVGVLFLTWFVFGSATINKQNQQILDGIQARQGQVLTRIDSNTAALAKGITCILRIEPNHRAAQNVKRCLRTSGLLALSK
jgi:hypothetical protein